MSWRLVAAALGLSIAGVSAPIAVTAIATSGLLGPPLVASALVALLVLVAAGVGLATVLSGLRRAAAELSARSGSEAEQAVFRVLVDALIFFYALGLAAGAPNPDQASPYLAVAAFALVVAWAQLLQIVLWPAARSLRRSAAMTLDIVLFSAFLHYGGAAVAGWYPLYLLDIVYAGFRFGLGALLLTAIGCILGFAAVVPTTEFWLQQPVLTTGLALALAVLPGLVAGPIRAIASARDTAAEVAADRRQLLVLIADNLRGLLATIGASLALGGRLTPPRQPDEPALTARAVRVLASQINDVLDLAALVAGTFVPPVEVFDLRALVKHGLVPLQADAAEEGIALRWRVDPHLPFRLRGRAEALARILASLAGHAIEAGDVSTVRIALDAAASDARRLQLRLVVETAGGEPEPEPAQAEAPLALILVRRLVALMGGALAIEWTPGQRTRRVVTLALAIEQGTAGPVLDLGRRPVLIASEDEEFAGELADPLAAWNGDVRWVADADTALAALAERPSMIPVLIIDGRRKLLSALSLADQAVRLGEAAPFVLLAADPAQIESLGEVDEGEVDGFIPTPLSERLLAGALHALPLGPLGPLAPERPAMPIFADPPRARAGEPTPRVGEWITPLAAHPKFAPETAALDMRAIEGLRELGGDPAFLRELVETFQADAQQIMERLDHAVAAADAAGFAQSLGALRRAASPLGGTQLCELLASLQGLTAGELRQRGTLHAQRLDAEIQRLAAALTEIAAATAGPLH